MIKFACVCFVDEKKKKYVVPVKDIKDFAPKAVDDFSTTQLYQVVWPVERREDSFTTELFYSANILLLAASTESMIARAKQMKILLPSAFVKSVGPSSSGSHSIQSDSNVDSVTMIKRVSKRARRQVNAALVTSCKQRQEAILKDLSESTPAAGTGPSKADELIDQKALKKIQNDDLDDSVMHIDKNSEEDDAQDGSKEKPTIPQSGGHQDLRIKTGLKKRKQTSSVSTSESEGTYESSDAERDRLLDKVATQQRQLNALTKRVRIVEAENASHQAQLSKFKEAANFFLKTISPDPQFFLSSPRKSIADWVDATVSHSGHKRKVGNTIDSSGSKSLNEKGRQQPKDYSEGCGQEVVTVGNAKKVLLFDVKEGIEPTKTPIKQDSGSNIQDDKKSPVKSPGKLNKTPVKKSKKEKESKKDKQLQLEPGEKGNKDLSEDILLALKNKKPLPEKTHGKLELVCIGNNTWIKKSLWTDKIIKSSMKLSIVTRELAEEIWGYKKCAKLSMAGGISPKTPKSEMKPQAPPGAVQAIYGVLRAKKIMEGMTLDSHLDEYLCKTGAKFLREKFNDCSAKLKQEMKLAEERAEADLAREAAKH